MILGLLGWELFYDGSRDQAAHFWASLPKLWSNAAELRKWNWTLMQILILASGILSYSLAIWMYGLHRRHFAEILQNIYLLNLIGILNMNSGQSRFRAFGQFDSNTSTKNCTHLPSTSKIFNQRKAKEIKEAVKITFLSGAVDGIPRSELLNLSSLPVFCTTTAVPVFSIWYFALFVRVRYFARQC